MNHRILSSAGDMKIHCIRLKRGEDLLDSIKAVCAEKNIRAAVVLSGVGCVLKGRIRDASGANIRDIPEHCEIVSLNGTVSAKRCHIHIALSKEDLSTIGGHLCSGCIINTTCELVLVELPGVAFDVQADAETGYNEVVFHNFV